MEKSVKINDEGVKQISCYIPYGQYKVLREISSMYALSVSRLFKKGIELVIEQYMEKGETNKEKDIEKEDDDWNDSQEPSES